MSHRYRRRGWADRHRPRVLDVSPGLTHESGPVRDRSWAPARVVVIAHWSTDPVPSRSVVTLLREFDSAGFETLLVSAAEVAGPLGRVCTWAPGEPSMPDRTTVLRRANVGYDFGSWAAVLHAYPGIGEAEHVVLTNDSLYGPFAPLSGYLRAFEADASPVWGAVAAAYPAPHLQSFLLGFKSGVLGTPGMQGFWSDIRAEGTKTKVIRYGELALSETLEELGLVWSAAISPPSTYDRNPAVHAPLALMDLGFPFLKRAVIGELTSLEEWESIKEGVVRAYGVNPELWLEGPIDVRPVPSRWAATWMELRAVHALDGTPAAARHMTRKARRYLSPRSAGPDQSDEVWLRASHPGF